MIEDWRYGGFGLYVHWPFCASKCPYCDFNSHVVAHVDQSRWAAALAKEIRYWGERTQGRLLNSIFFGGGTPSLMDVSTVASVLEEARKCWTWANDIEITLEANPSSVDASRFEGYAKAGVNRVSMGVQSLIEDDLKRLGRLHSVAEALAAFDIARSVFNRVSFDLIYARQNQSLADWRNELSMALDLAVDHLSLYQLTIEDGTAFGDRHARGLLKGLPEEGLSADMFDVTRETCETFGYSQYEVSNYAVPGAESRHNLIYWRGGDYVGVGPGAHGRVTLENQGRFATRAHSTPGKWIEQAETGTSLAESETLNLQDHVYERFIMGLRLTEGLDIERINAIRPDCFDNEQLEFLQSKGLIWRKDNKLGATREGQSVLNMLITELAPE